MSFVKISFEKTKQNNLFDEKLNFINLPLLKVTFDHQQMSDLKNFLFWEIFMLY